jgi:hypothetical protein
MAFIYDVLLPQTDSGPQVAHELVGLSRRRERFQDQSQNRTLRIEEGFDYRLKTLSVSLAVGFALVQ